MTDEERRAYYREYFKTHPEQREKRSAYTKQWIKKNYEEWKRYMREYQRNKRMEKAKQSLKEDGYL